MEKGVDDKTMSSFIFQSYVYSQVVYKDDDLRLNSRQSHSYSFFSQSASAGQSENVPRPVSNSSATTEDSSLLGRLGPRLLRMADTDGTVHINCEMILSLLN